MPAPEVASLMTTGLVLLVAANANVVLAKNISNAKRGITPQDRLAALKVEWVTWVMALRFWKTKKSLSEG